MLSCLRCARHLRGTASRATFTSRAAPALAPVGAEDPLAGADHQQVSMMSEPCIVVDDNDVPLRAAPKVDCHLYSKILSDGMLHRAFSVFLFNSEGHLLLQQRSFDKITFPGVWANTCCSHPLWVEEEMDDADAIGVKRAAVRKLDQELGISDPALGPEAFHYLTRIHYRAPAPDGKWGEHEIDYILLAQADVAVRPNPNEVAQARFFSREELRPIVEDPEAHGYQLSPWFHLLARRRLFSWWDQLDALRGCEERDTIHRWIEDHE